MGTNKKGDMFEKRRMGQESEECEGIVSVSDAKGMHKLKQ